MTSPVRYELHNQAPSGARAGTLHTRFGAVPTPTFMPVGTHANVRPMTMDEIAATGARILLANTYHLLLRPGAEVFKHFGGIHRFSGWKGGFLTDSGGFQIFSLPDDREITEEGARFRSPFDNHHHLLSPESSIAMQQAIGSDIMMVLDVCLPSTSPEDKTRQAMEQTHRWALRSLAAARSVDTGQAVFAIVQGGVFKHLRNESAAFLTGHPFDGFAIGGLAVGESRELLYSMCEHTVKLLPEDKPRYLMGVGTPIDLLECVKSGVDMFDCIIPTKMAQQNYCYTFEGRLRLSRSEYRLSEEPLDKTCDCVTCTNYTRGFLYHLASGGHHLAARLFGIHNIRHFQVLMKRLRDSILENRFDAEYRELKKVLEPPRKIPEPVEGSGDGDFELVTLKNGTRAVRHKGHGEIMHPGVGPWEEANRLYIEQVKLKDVLQVSAPRNQPFKILDVGLGAAANAIAAMTCAKQLEDKRRRNLEIVSLEVDLAPLRLALDDPEGFPFITPWAEQVRLLLRWRRWDKHGVSWRLLEGDAEKTLAGAGKDFDLIFQDPFSPDNNSTLWTVDWLTKLRELANPDGAQLVTYSSATPTRVSLLLAGWYVGAGLSSGSRTETTIAATRRDLLAEPLGPRWLDRWSRSSAKAPHGEELTKEHEAAIRAHPQFSAPPTSTTAA